MASTSRINWRISSGDSGTWEEDSRMAYSQAQPQTEAGEERRTRDRLPALSPDDGCFRLADRGSQCLHFCFEHAQLLEHVGSAQATERIGTRGVGRRWPPGHSAGLLHDGSARNTGAPNPALRNPMERIPEISHLDLQRRAIDGNLSGTRQPASVTACSSTRRCSLLMRRPNCCPR